MRVDVSSLIRTNLLDIDDLFRELVSRYPEKSPSVLNPYQARLWKREVIPEAGVNVVIDTNGDRNFCVDNYALDGSGRMTGFNEFIQWPSRDQVETWDGELVTLEKLLPVVRSVVFGDDETAELEDADEADAEGVDTDQKQPEYPMRKTSPEALPYIVKLFKLCLAE